MLMIYHYTKFQMPSSNITLLIDLKSKAKKRVHAAAILLFYILQKITITKVAYSSNICYHTTFQDPILSGASVAHTSQINGPVMLVLTFVES
jgi:hypothetical protein